MRYKALSEVAPAVASSKRLSSDSIIWHLTLDQIKSSTGSVEHPVLAPVSEAGSSTSFFDEKNVLYSKLRPYLNKVICPEDFGVATTELVPLRPKPQELNRYYLCYYLRSPAFVSWISGQVAGAKMPRVNMKSFWSHKIPLPPLDDQIRIAHLLGKVERLIVQRKENLRQLDDLLKSVFWEMFGRFIRNEAGYDLITKACDFIDYRGKTPPRVKMGIPLISAKCVRRGYFDGQRLDYITEDTYNEIMTRGFPETNDVLFTTEGATFGFTCRIPRHFNKFAVGQRLITLRCKDGYQPEVLDFLLNNAHIQKKLASRLSGSAALGIRSAVAIPFPPQELQIQFMSIVEKVEPLVCSLKESLAGLENLYGALSQKAFKGELDLARVAQQLSEKSLS